MQTPCRIQEHDGRIHADKDECSQKKPEVFGNFHPHKRRCRLENAEAGAVESGDNRCLHDLDRCKGQKDCEKHAQQRHLSQGQ